MRAALLLLVALHSGCFWAVGGTVGGISAARHNSRVHDEPPRQEIILAVPPTEAERATCQGDRARISAAAARAPDASTRMNVLATMPNCLALGTPATTLYIPGKRAERKGVANHALAGMGIGLLIDAFVVAMALRDFHGLGGH